MGAHGRSKLPQRCDPFACDRLDGGGRGRSAFGVTGLNATGPVAALRLCTGQNAEPDTSGGFALRRVLGRTGIHGRGARIDDPGPQPVPRRRRT